jgi:simple sugar transport system permease protein
VPNEDARLSALARSAVEAALVGVIAIAALAVLLLVAGFPVGAALAALWRGAFGSTDAFLSSTLVRAIPLLLIGCGMVIALRAGVINLGGDGQLLAGAVAATSIALWWEGGGWLAIAVSLVAAAASGAGWTMLPAWLKIRFGTLEVVSTIMMNFVAAYGVSYLVRGPLQEPSGVYPQSASIPVHEQLPLLVSGTRLHTGIVFAVLAVAATWLYLEHTAAGFRIRAVGSNARAAELAGRIDGRRVQRGAFLTSGALAGLAGGIEVLGVTFALYENLSPGYGFSAIAVALLARLGPLHVGLSALLLGALAAGATAMQRDAGIPSGAAAAVEATLILVLLGGQALLVRRGDVRPRRRVVAG